jgi:hypothetical protein
VRPILEEVLDVRVQELATRHEESWRGFFEYLTQDADVILVSGDQAAKMLNVSVASIQRLKQRGELPESQRFKERTVRHQLKDMLAFARGKGMRINSLEKP